MVLYNSGILVVGQIKFLNSNPVNGAVVIALQDKSPAAVPLIIFEILDGKKGGSSPVTQHNVTSCSA